MATVNYYINSSTGNDAWDGTSPTFVSGTTGPKEHGQAMVDTLVDPITDEIIINLAGTVVLRGGNLRRRRACRRRRAATRELRPHAKLDGRSRRASGAGLLHWRQLHSRQFALRARGALAVETRFPGVGARSQPVHAGHHDDAAARQILRDPRRGDEPRQGDRSDARPLRRQSGGGEDFEPGALQKRRVLRRLARIGLDAAGRAGDRLRDAGQ